MSKLQANLIIATMWIGFAMFCAAVLRYTYGLWGLEKLLGL